MSQTTTITTTTPEGGTTVTTVTLKANGFYDEIEIEDMDFNEDTQTYTYPCPCGDKFQITLEELYDCEEVATCPSCSLIIRVIYNPEDLPELAA